MGRLDDDPREVDDSRAGCFLWVLLLLALIVSSVVSNWAEIWDSFQEFLGN